MTEYPEVGKLYRVQYSMGAHVPAFIPRPCRLGAQASQSDPGKTSLPPREYEGRFGYCWVGAGASFFQMVVISKGGPKNEYSRPGENRDPPPHKRDPQIDLGDSEPGDLIYLIERTQQT
jgi:hypothetical protein